MCILYLRVMNESLFGGVLVTMNFIGEQRE